MDQKSNFNILDPNQAMPAVSKGGTCDDPVLSVVKSLTSMWTLPAAPLSALIQVTDSTGSKER